MTQFAVEARAVVAGQRAPVGHRAIPGFALRRLRRGPSDRRRWFRPARSGRRGRRLRWTCCTGSCAVPCPAPRWRCRGIRRHGRCRRSTPILPMMCSDQILGADAGAPACHRRDREMSSACAAAGIAWPARGRLRWCRCRTPARRRRRGCEVWLSPQTMVMPGWVAPSSGPITCTMPRCALLQPCRRDAELAAVASPAARPARRPRRWHRHAGRCASAGMVGVEWSSVASTRSGRRTCKPALAQFGEGLRRGDFVDQVQVDVEDCRAWPRFRPRPGARPRVCRAGCGVSCSSRSLLLGVVGGFGGCGRLAATGVSHPH